MQCTYSFGAYMMLKYLIDIIHNPISEVRISYMFEFRILILDVRYNDTRNIPEIIRHYQNNKKNIYHLGNGHVLYYNYYVGVFLIYLYSYDDIASVFLLHFGPLRDVYYGYISRYMCCLVCCIVFFVVCALYFIP